MLRITQNGFRPDVNSQHSPLGIIVITATPNQQPLDLRYLASRFDISKVDLIPVERFEHETSQ